MLSRISYFIFNEKNSPPTCGFSCFWLHSSNSTLALGMVAVCWVYPPVEKTPVARRAAWRSLERRRAKRRWPPRMDLGMPI